MKHHIFSLVLIVSLASHCLAAPTEQREWKSSKGTVILAKAVYVGDNLVVLKREDGKEISVSIQSLSQKDQDFLKSLKTPETTEKSMEKEAAPEPPEIDKNEGADTDTDADLEKKKVKKSVATGSFLPKLTEGAGIGYHAYYKGERFIAKIDSKGTMFVYYLDEKGQEVTKWKMVIHSQSFTRIKNKLKRYSFQKILTHGEPQLNPKEVKFTFLREGAITSEIIYEFNPKGFTTWTRSEITKEAPDGVKHIMRHLFPDMDKFSTEKDFNKKMTVEIENMKGNEEKITFEEVEVPKGNTNKFEFKGPLFGKGKLVIERCEDIKAKFIINPYPASPLKSGFTIFNSKEDFASKDHKNEKTTFTFK